MGCEIAMVYLLAVYTSLLVFIIQVPFFHQVLDAVPKYLPLLCTKAGMEEML